MERVISPGSPIVHRAGIRRAKSDRRTFTWRTVFFGFLRSRRREHRRQDDANVVFIDWHHPWLFFLAVGIMILSSMDAFMTLQLINLGATEVNPVMAAIMGKGTMAFAVSKMLMTAIGILMLVFLAKAVAFNAFRTGVMLTVAFSFYCCLVCYEFVLLLAQF